MECETEKGLGVTRGWEESLCDIRGKGLGVTQETGLRVTRGWGRSHGTHGWEEMPSETQG